MSASLSTIEYRDVPGFPGYRVGDDGSIWSRRGRRWYTLRRKWTQLKPKKDPGGRMRIALYLGESQKRHHGANGRVRRLPVYRFVHRLVLMAFVGPCPPGMVACHANDDSEDNRLANLRWDTSKANAADALRNGRYHLGLANRNARLSEDQVRELRKLHAQGVSCTSLARITGVSETAVRYILQRKNWAWL